MRAPWFDESHSKASLNPLYEGHWDPDGYLEDGAVSRFFGRLYQQGHGHGFQQWEYRRPVGPLRHRVRVPGCGPGREVTVPSAAGGVAFAPGQMVSMGVLRTGATILGQPVGGLLGVSAWGLEMLDDGAFSSVRVISSDPDTIEAGVTNLELTITGEGFKAGDVLVACLYIGDEDSADFGKHETDPYVTLHDSTWVSEYEMTVQADAVAGTPDGYRFGVGVRR